jgi:predicted nucleic acid-binding protein
MDRSNVRHQEAVDVLENKDIVIFISLITAIELIVGAKDKAHLIKINKELRAFLIILPDQEIALLAIKLLRQYSLSHGLKIQDCFIADFPF